MKYDKEITQKLIADYESGKTVAEISAMMTLSHGEPVPDRSIIAKLSSLGVYRKKEYLTKRGETPIKKEEYIERIAKLLDVNAEILESLEKVNKSVLALIEKKLTFDPVAHRQRALAETIVPPVNYFYGGLGEPGGLKY
jgi:hypothetical protein